MLESRRRIKLVVRIAEPQFDQYSPRGFIGWMMAHEQTSGVEPLKGVLDHGACGLNGQPLSPTGFAQMKAAGCIGNTQVRQMDNR
jgi:hypothetical protein